MEPPSHDSAIGGDTLVSRSRSVSPVAASAFLETGAHPRVVWISPGGLEMAGVGAAATISVSEPDRFESVKTRAETLFDAGDHDGPAPSRPRFVGGFSFTDTHDPSPPWTEFPAATFILPRIQITAHEEACWVTVTTVGPDVDPAEVASTLDAVEADLETLPELEAMQEPPGVARTEPNPEKREWQSQVDDAVTKIRDGDIEKVVLGRALSAELQRPVDPVSMVERLRHQYPNCYRFLFEPTAGVSFLGVPPERFVRLDDSTVSTEAVAGSVDRGDSLAEDTTLADRLRNSQKLQTEQQLVTDAIVAQLNHLGSVTVGDQTVRKLTNIQHLQTPITATLDQERHILDVVESLHPTPAVGGVPPGKALDTIEAFETFPRGWYAAPVGWFDAEGDGEFAVAIRSALTRGDEATVYAGNGIVADSDPSEEWEELQAKYRPILEALG